MLLRRSPLSTAGALSLRRCPLSTTSVTGGGGAKDAKKLPPVARARPDSAPLYEQMRRERRGATERADLERRRASLRRRQFEEADEQPLQAARQKPAQLPPNCLPWRQYALFADPPRLKPLKAAEDAESFAGLLRRSAFVGLGDFHSRVVYGRIFERFEGSLYVDFGGKFHAVCPAPRVNSDRYVRGAQVTLRLLDPEMTSRFLGSERHVTLAEADAVLMGLRPADGEAEAAAEDEAEEAEEADTVSPLRPVLMQLSMAEAAATEAASAAAVGDLGAGEAGVGEDWDAGDDGDATV